jgi:hypothetical protein
MSVMSTRQASAEAAVGGEFMVPELWDADPRAAGSATRWPAGPAGGSGGGWGSGRGSGASRHGERGLHVAEVHLTEFYLRELRIREVRAGRRDARRPEIGAGRADRVRPAGARAAGSTPAPLRLTRRGRAVVAVLTVLAAAAVVMLLWLVVAGGAQAASHGEPAGAGYRGMTSIVVRPGQTLWSIAVSAEPAANPWVVIRQIVDANALSGTSVRSGQQLWVPRG